MHITSGAKARRTILPDLASVATGNDTLFVSASEKKPLAETCAAPETANRLSGRRGVPPITSSPTPPTITFAADSSDCSSHT